MSSSIRVEGEGNVLRLYDDGVYLAFIRWDRRGIYSRYSRHQLLPEHVDKTNGAEYLITTYLMDKAQAS